MKRQLLLLAVTAAISHAADASPEALRQLMRDCLTNLRKSDEAQRHYTFKMKVDERDFSSPNSAKVNSRLLQRDYAGNITITRLLARNGVPLTDEERQKNDAIIQKRVAEIQAQTPEQRAKDAERRKKNQNNMDDWYREAPEALDYKAAGEETIDGRRVLIIEFSPHANYKPFNIWARVFRKMNGKAWIDAEENELLKADARMFSDVTIGWGLVGRLNEGTGFFLERQRIAPHTWLPKMQKDHYTARIVFKTVRGDETTEFFDYKKN